MHEFETNVINRIRRILIIIRVQFQNKIVNFNNIFDINFRFFNCKFLLKFLLIFINIYKFLRLIVLSMLHIRIIHF